MIVAVVTLLLSCLIATCACLFFCFILLSVLGSFRVAAESDDQSESMFKQYENALRERQGQSSSHQD